jgi:hypothetical protein
MQISVVQVFILNSKWRWEGKRWIFGNAYDITVWINVTELLGHTDPQTLRTNVRFQVLTAASMMFRIVFWDDGGSTRLWNVGRQLFYTAVHPRRQLWTLRTKFACRKLNTVSLMDTFTPVVIVLADGVRLCLWTAITNGPVVHPSDNIRICWNPGGMILTAKNRRTRAKTCPSDTLSTINATWTDPGLRGERPATDRLSHGTALQHMLLFPSGLSFLSLIVT